MYQMWSKSNIWPDRDLVDYYMPECFQSYHSATRVIVYGTEVPICKPKNPISQQASWNSYKNKNTLKVLVAATPGGLMSFCSPAYCGSTSDRQIVERGNLINKCEQGDSIIADRGFNVQDLFVSKSVSISIPTFSRGESQLSRQKASKPTSTYQKAYWPYQNLQNIEDESAVNYIPSASGIFFICLMCCDFREGIVKKNSRL